MGDDDAALLRTPCHMRPGALPKRKFTSFQKGARWLFFSSLVIVNLLPNAAQRQ